MPAGPLIVSVTQEPGGAWRVVVSVRPGVRVAWLVPTGPPDAAALERMLALSGRLLTRG